MAVFEKVLDEKTEEAVKIARKRISETMEGKVPIEKLVISRGCKNFNSTTTRTPRRTVQAAKKLMAMGYEFVPGMKVSWIVTNSRRTPQEVEPCVEGTHVRGHPGLAVLCGPGGAERSPGPQRSSGWTREGPARGATAG